MKGKKSITVFLFIGLLLIVVFVVGQICEKNPTALLRKYQYDYALESFCTFCVNWWLPAGIIGFPMFLISLIISLVRESREKSKSDSQ